MPGPDGSLGPLEYVLNTPSHHRVHHRPGQGHRGYIGAGELDHERGTIGCYAAVCCTNRLNAEPDCYCVRRGALSA